MNKCEGCIYFGRANRKSPFNYCLMFNQILDENPEPLQDDCKRELTQ